MSKKILVTGGTGNTGAQVAKRLYEMGHKPIVASRSDKKFIADMEIVKFDWLDENTYNHALKGVEAVYLVAPSGVADPVSILSNFIDIAKKLDVRRFVLLSASLLECGGPAMGKVHQKLAKDKDLEWCVLRPSWFMQNFSKQQHLSTIRDEGKIYAATDDGKIPFIDADDIAEVAVHALTITNSYNDDFILTGPRALSYGQAAEIISEAIDKPVSHKKLTVEQLTQRWQGFGLDLDYAKMLSEMDTVIKDGVEDRTTDSVLNITGKPPISLEAFVLKNIGVWQ
ncbi:MAG: ergot alkaloid biosynthesis protein [Alphaproteobacteria bacterium]|nr:ergot alkaloid biosynthesis protein [Alphaproteobacteria bacterium]